MRSNLAGLSAIACAASLYFLSILPASADSAHFTSPGWYQIADVFLGEYIVAGPFGDKGTCEAGLPKDEDAVYDCE